MPSLRSILFGGVLPILALAHPPSARDDYDIENKQDFDDLLRSIPDESIEAALAVNLAPKFRPGVFEDTQYAISAVHNDDPELATRLVGMAREDASVKDYLRKRQDNTTITTTTAIVVVSSELTTTASTTETIVVPTSSPTTTSQDTTTATQQNPAVSSSTVVEPLSTTIVVPPPATTTETGVIVPVVVSSTDSQGTVVAQTTSAFVPSASTSIAVAITTTNSQGQVVTTSTVAPAVAVTTTDSKGSTITTASPVSNVAVGNGGQILTSGSKTAASAVTTTDSFGATVTLSHPTSGGVYTISDSAGHVVTVTWQPTAPVVSELDVETATLPDGQVTTITSFKVVGPATSTATTPASTSKTPGLSGAPSTQLSQTTTIFAALVGIMSGIAVWIL